ncbi:hypothetical protein QDT04_15240 [Acinetobacter baumannii]|uniref:hypothetical protein n=1 Tax=Acinetobacter baumannii TaxID=470 RepID=UPI001D77965A|nr:hypothetical protein [Acinetobacter baumannii]EHU1307159.1 hypothetical protein [Acinetobacter baumannii]EHU2440828.1 hypothetical protein [Acinetobacter baumannii]MDH2600644.1 hypothetical protein [Acinetobacter baumannii]
MSEGFINQAVSEHTKELFGLINGRDKVIKNITNLKDHPVWGTSFFSDKEKEIILNKLETVEVLVSNEDSVSNTNNFFNLLVSHVNYLNDDLNELYKLRDKTPVSYINVNKNNNAGIPYISTFKTRFPIEQQQQVLLTRVKFSIESLLDVAKQFNKLYEAVNKTLPPYLQSLMGRVNDELVSFRRLRNIADNARTENIYDNAVNKYRDLEENYRSYFYWGIGIVLCLSVALLTLKQILVPYLFSTIEFWAVKVSLLLVGITLISYFLKQSAHYQRLADQNYQTQVELQAYPSFMESIPTEEAASVRKELALKYFGREIDAAAHKDMGNLVSDQMKSTTEMVKATTEAIKNLKG